MKRRVLSIYVVTFSALFAFRGVGEEESADIRPLRLEPPQPESRNRFGLSYRMGFNISANFRNFGRFSSIFPGTARRTTPDGDPYNYDNGYVLPDSGTPNSGLTHYWGYLGTTLSGGSQLPGNGTILMQNSSSRGFSQGFDSGDRESDPLSGFEVTYNRELGRTAQLRWGIESAFNYMNLSINDGQPIHGTATLRTDVLTDVYALQVPEAELPPAPYTGRKSTPGVVLAANPESSQTSSSEAAIPETVTGSRHFDADVFGFRLGPYLEWALNDRVSVAFSGGLALAQIDSNFRFTETIQAGSFPMPATQGSSSHNDLLAGGYVEGTASCSLTKSTGVFAAVQFQDLGQYSHWAGGREAVLDLSHSMFVSLGLSYSF